MHVKVMKNILHDIGLTDVEAKVYLALLKNGSSLAGKISRDTGVHRRTVYDAIERLIEKGLVSYIRTNNRKYFEAVHPRRLLEILKERETDVVDMLPELEAQFKFVKEKKETVFFRGKKAMQTIFNEQMAHSGVVYYSGGSKVLGEIAKSYLKKYDSTRKEKKIKMFIITDSAGREIKELNNLYSCKTKFLKKWNENKTVMGVYGDNVVIVNWDEDPIAIVIKEKEIAKGFLNYFDILWNVAKE